MRIDDMKPGPELDLKAIEILFEWKAWKNMRGEYTYIVFQKSGEREPYKRYRDWESEMHRYEQIPFSDIDRMKHIVAGVPELSTTWEGMRLVVEEMQRRGWDYRIESYKWETSFVFIQREHEGYSEQAGTDIPYLCVLAAIGALQGEDTQP